MSTTIVLLNGSPSAGKTTLAEALHRALPVPAFHLSLDEFRTGIRSEFWLEPPTPSLFSLMVRAYLRSLEAVADQGLMVISESIILPDTRELYEPLFAAHSVVLIGVRCSLLEAQRRELQRGDRRSGPVDLDVPEFNTVHDHHYHLEVDTSAESTQRSVERVLGLLDIASR